MALPTGTRFGAYEVLSRIGAGGMGEVYRARDTTLHRDVAIKVLLPALANDPDRLARFDREAQLLASLNHPNIAHIHGLADANGVRAFVMELVEGPTLADQIVRGSIPMNEALPIAKQIADALEAAHDHGIIRRLRIAGRDRARRGFQKCFLAFSLVESRLRCAMPSTRSLLIGAQALAVAALLVHSSGSPVAAQQRDPAGLVKADAAVATFAKDVAPIFQKNCQQCHQSGAIGPMPLTTFEEVRPWARAIKQKVVAGEMPPYRYDREVGIQKLKNDLRLSPQEIQTIARWVDNGAPLGNPADLPPPVTFPDANKWGFADQFGPPDIVIRTKPFTLQARGQDVWWRPIVPTGLTKDRCLKAVSVKPSVRGRAAAHHANSDLLVYDEKQNQYVDGERLTEYALGKVGEIVPLDSCRTIPANSMVRWDVHYYPIGKELEDDVIEMGLWLYPEGHQAKHKQDLKLYSLLMKGGELEIPPNGTAMTQGFHTFKTPVRIDSFQPHGHFRLVGKTLEIFYPETGKLEMISSVSNWTNNWHTSHIYDDDAAPLVPKGAVLVITGYYDNTAGNKQNPDPDQWVGLGSRTADEMSHAWIAVTHLDDETYQRLVAEREQRKKNATEQRSAP